MITTRQAAGGVLFTMALLSIAHGIGLTIPRSVAAACGWAAGLLLFSQLNNLQRSQVILMLLAGSAGLLFGAFNGTSPDLEAAFSINQAMLTMLAAVSFLRLITQPVIGADERLPQGRGALWRTLLGVHFFGSVINMSTIVIVGDRLSANRPMTALQASVLSRSFAMAACWSPFFAAMAVALTHAPGADLKTLSLIGFPVALCGLLIIGWQLTRSHQADDFYGYPMHFGSLWVPALLAIAMVLLHHLWPQLPMLTLISMLALGLPLLLLPIREGSTGALRLIHHVTDGLPRMHGELLLFLAAGVLATGIVTLTQVMGIDFRLTHFNASHASLLLAMMVGLSLVGIHPVISITTCGGILAPVVNDINLLGITFLMSWALGICSSPLSGLNLAIQGRYRIRPLTLLKLNARFSLIMLGACSLALHLYQAWSR